MYKEISKLIIFGDMPNDSILVKMSNVFKILNVFKKFTDNGTTKDDLIKRNIYTDKTIADNSYRLWI